MNQKPLPEDVEQLIQDMQYSVLPMFRKSAAEQLQRLSVSYPQVVSALLATQKIDRNFDVRAAAAAALCSLNNQEIYLQLQAEIGDLFSRAQQAHNQGDRRGASILVNRILQLDFFHQGAWELLHNQYGMDKSLDEFQKGFIQKYFPDKLPLIVQPPEQPEELSEKNEPVEASQNLLPAEDLSGQEMDHQPAESVPDIIFCPSCAHELAAGTRFCGHCGYDTESNLESTPLVQAEESQRDSYASPSRVETYSDTYTLPSQVESTPVQSYRSRGNQLSTVRLKRQKRFQVNIGKFEIFFDGNMVGTIGNGEETEFTVPEGNHEIKLEFRGNAARSLSFIAKGNEVIDLVCGFDVDRGGLFLANTRSDTPAQEVEDLLTHGNPNSITYMGAKAIKPLAAYIQRQMKYSDAWATADESLCSLLSAPSWKLLKKSENVGNHARRWGVVGVVIGMIVAVVVVASGWESWPALFAPLIGGFLAWSVTFTNDPNVLSRHSGCSVFFLIFTPIVAVFLAMEHSSLLKDLKEKREIYESSIGELLALPDNNPPRVEDLQVTRRMASIGSVRSQLASIVVGILMAIMGLLVIAYIIYLISSITG